MSDLDRRLAVLEAKDEIRELTARYCHAIVDGDTETIVQLFCRNGIFRMRKMSVQGHAALTKFYSGGVGEQTYKPFIQNHVIELESTTQASGRCSVEIRIVQDGQGLYRPRATTLIVISSKMVNGDFGPPLQCVSLCAPQRWLDQIAWRINGACSQTLCWNRFQWKRGAWLAHE